MTATVSKKTAAPKANRAPTMDEMMTVALEANGISFETMRERSTEAFGWYAGALCLGGFMLRQRAIESLKIIAEFDKLLSELKAEGETPTGPRASEVVRKGLDGAVGFKDLARHYGSLARAMSTDMADLEKKVEKRLAQFMKKYPSVDAAKPANIDPNDPASVAFIRPDAK